MPSASETPEYCTLLRGTCLHVRSEDIQCEPLQRIKTDAWAWLRTGHYGDGCTGTGVYRVCDLVGRALEFSDDKRAGMLIDGWRG
jgi:hypothetical protein